MLLEAVGVAAGEIGGLLDDAVALDAAAKGAQLRVENVDFLAGQMGQLLEAAEAARVQQVGKLRPDALQPHEIVRRVASARKMPVDGGADELAGDVAGGGGCFGGEVVGFAP